MKVEGRLLIKMKALSNNLELCLKAKDINSPDFHSMRNSWEEIEDIFLSRKERG